MSPASYRAAPPRAVFVPTELYGSIGVTDFAGKAIALNASCAPRKPTRILEQHR
jgi:hypothetical protein